MGKSPSKHYTIHIESPVLNIYQERLEFDDDEEDRELDIKFDLVK